ncbi:MAG: GTP-binding protein [Acidithiobacillus sp.]
MKTTRGDKVPGLSEDQKQGCAAYTKKCLDRAKAGRYAPRTTPAQAREQAEQALGWLKELRGEHVAESEQYGITSFVYRARRPFHPQRIWRLIHGDWDGILRSKGYFWLASRFDFAGNWAQAGGACRHGLAGLWWSAVDRKKWPDDPEYLVQIQKILRVRLAIGDRSWYLSASE